MSSSSKFLALTALTEFWDLTKEIILVGDWCITSDNERIINDVSAIDAVEHWTCDAELIDAVIYTNEVYEESFPTLIEWLNDVHETDRSQRYWKIVIGRFFHYYINFLYDRYVTLKRAMDENAGLSTIGLSQQSYTVRYDYHLFKDACMHSDLFNLQLFSQVGRQLGIDMECREAPPPGANNNSPKIWRYIRSRLRPVKQAVSRRLLLKDHGFTSTYSFHNASVPDITLRRLWWKSGFRVSKLDKKYGRYDHNRSEREQDRQSLKDLNGQDDFSTFMLRSLSVNLPYAFLEDFTSIQRSVLRRIERKRPKVIVVGHPPKTAQSIWVGECVERGTKLVGVQHGGLYGEFKYEMGEWIERKVADRYVTWGWRKSDKDARLPALKLSDIDPTEQENPGAGILWLATIITRYHNHLWGQLAYPKKDTYVRRQDRFYRQLEEALRDILTLRLKPDKKGNEAIKQWWNGRHPNLTIEDTRVPFRQRARESRLVVIDHFGSTPLLELLVMKKPVIVYCHRDDFYLSDEAIPYYDSMFEAGIFHRQPETAANLINTIHDDVEEWWQEPSRQDTLRRFADNFAYTSPDATAEWIRFLRSSH